jgi:monoterpene epsilon-lactone hydrolase
MMTADGGATRREVLGAALLGAASVAAPLPLRAEAPVPGRLVPERRLPVPATVSPELAARVGAALPAGWDAPPTDAAGWRALAQASAAHVAPELPGIKARLGVTVEPGEIAGVPVFHIAPADLPEANRDRLLLHLHGGAYVLYPGEAGAGEGMVMAGYGRFHVVSVDYRMAPDHPFPAALDDAFAVYEALLARHDPARMAVFGSSAGGGLTLALMLRARDAGLALPAAMAPGTPWADLTGQGDSRQANEFVDNVLVSDRGVLSAAAALYAGGADLADPRISPLLGDFRGLPPAILTSGTRDLLLSDAARVHRKLRQAGVDAALQVLEAQSHAQFLEPFIPENEAAFAEIAAFLDARLAR